MRSVGTDLILSGLLFLSQQQKHLIETTWGKVDCLRLIVSNDSVFHIRESVVEQSNPQWDVGRKFRKWQGNTQFSRTCPQWPTFSNWVPAYFSHFPMMPLYESIQGWVPTLDQNPKIWSALEMLSRPIQTWASPLSQGIFLSYEYDN